MKLVQLTQDTKYRKAGEVLRVDDKSAVNLVEKRKVAEYFDPAKSKVDVVARTAPQRGVGASVVVVDADEPAAPASADEPTAAAEPHPEDVERDRVRAELIAAGVVAGKGTEDQLAALDDDDLAAVVTA